MIAPDKQPRISPGFLRSMVGIAYTVLAWIGPWSWPAWPAMAVLEISFSPARPFVALSRDARVIVVVALMFTNVASWAVLAWGVSAVRERLWSPRSKG